MTNRNDQDESAVVDLRPFSNPYTSGILFAIILMVALGGLLFFLSHSWKLWVPGLLLAIGGVLLGVIGLKEFDEDPPTGGALFFWNIPLMRGDEQIVVGGRTILADYFPFYLSATEVDFSNKNHQFDVTLVSRDNVKLTGKVLITARPNQTDLRDFFQSGKDMKAVFEQMVDLVQTKCREVGKDHDHLELVQNGQRIGSPLKDHLLESGSFGIHIFKVNVVLELPDKISTAMQGKVTEVYDRTNEQAEYATNIAAAQALQSAYIADPRMLGRIPTLQECLEQILHQRLIRDGKSTGVQNKGGKTIAVVNPNQGQGQT